jgi:hypothetical protein
VRNARVRGLYADGIRRLSLAIEGVIRQG